jgi:8-oxo-dGTP pyrophosphatase MutT (NUDIX family)
MSENPWITRSTRVVYDNPWISVREDQVTRPDGQTGIYGVVSYKHRAVGILPIEADGSIWLVGQWRYPLDRYSWEIPEGGGRGEETDEECARRELEEETGLAADHLEPLIESHLSNAVSDEWGIVFRATGLRPGVSHPEGCERLEVKRVPFATALRMVREGAITDSLSVIAILHEALDEGSRSALQTQRPRALELFPEKVAIIRLSPHDAIPDWASTSRFLSLTRTTDELSLVAEQSLVPSEVRAERGWRALKVEGPIPFEETGVIAGLSSSLSRASVPLFVISTHDTDVILVPESRLARAIEELRSLGHTVRA